jgi:hypothetical protein
VRIKLAGGVDKVIRGGKEWGDCFEKFSDKIFRNENW